MWRNRALRIIRVHEPETDCGRHYSLRAEEWGLLGGVGSIEAIVIVVLVLLAGVLDGVTCFEIVDSMLGNAKGNLGRRDSCDQSNSFRIVATTANNIT
jgi:hypothetical protein